MVSSDWIYEIAQILEGTEDVVKPVNNWLVGKKNLDEYSWAAGPYHVLLDVLVLDTMAFMSYVLHKYFL